MTPISHVFLFSRGKVVYQSPSSYNHPRTASSQVRHFYTMQVWKPGDPVVDIARVHAWRGDCPDCAPPGTLAGDLATIRAAAAALVTAVGDGLRHAGQWAGRWSEDPPPTEEKRT
jgi:hypothetical protein